MKIVAVTTRVVNAEMRNWVFVRVETDQDVCPASMTMGPYGSPTEAEQALTRVAERNEQWDAEDARWAGDKP